MSNPDNTINRWISPKEWAVIEALRAGKVEVTPVPEEWAPLPASAYTEVEQRAKFEELHAAALEYFEWRLSDDYHVDKEMDWEDGLTDKVMQLLGPGVWDAINAATQ